VKSKQKESQVVLMVEPAEEAEAEEKGTISTFLQSRIHESFTRAADQLYAMGLLTTEERIVISSCIGDALEAFANIMNEKVPSASDMEVPVEVAQEILRNAILHRRQGIIRVAQEAELGAPISSEYLDLPDRDQDHRTLRELIELALIDEANAAQHYDNMLEVVEQMDLPVDMDRPNRKALEEIFGDTQGHEKILERMLEREANRTPVIAATLHELLVRGARHAFDKCMKCSASPTLDVHWADGRAHAWFCDKHFKKWMEEEHDRKNGSDIVGLKEITDGVASKHFTDNPNPDIKGRFFKKAALFNEEELRANGEIGDSRFWQKMWSRFLATYDTPALPTTEAELYEELIAIKRAAQEKFRFDPNSTENEGRWRLIDPKIFEQGSVRRWNIWKEIKAPGVQFVMGKDTRDNEWKPQAVRFKKFDAKGQPLWTEEKAAKWWDQNKGEFTKEWVQSNWDEWMQKHPDEISPDYTGQGVQEAVKVAQVPTMDVAQCLECGRYFDTWTGDVSEEPPPDTETQPTGLCSECARRLYEEILLEEATPEVEPAELEREYEETFLEETPEQVAMKRDAASGYCEMGGEWSDQLQQHRMRPGWEGGEYKPGNIQLLCPKHHEEVHQETGEFEMGGQWRHDLLLKELGPEEYSKWQAERGKERQKGLREQMGEEAYSNYQRLLALWRWHPEMFEHKPRFGPKGADLDVPKTLSIDLDGTVLEYDGHQGVGVFGLPKPGARETLSRFKDDGWFLIIDTCRGEVPLIVEHLAMYNIPFDAVNFNPFQPDTANPGKPMANYRIDDSAIYFNGDWGAVYDEVGRRDREKELFAIKVAWVPPVNVKAALWDLSNNLVDEEWSSILPYVDGVTVDEVVASWTADQNTYRMVRCGAEYKVFRNFDVIYSSDGALNPFEQVRVCSDIVESGMSAITPSTVVRDAMADLLACLRKRSFNAPSEWLRVVGWDVEDDRRIVRVEVNLEKFRKCNRALAIFATSGTVADLLRHIAHNGAFAYDPQRGILIDFLDPFGHRTQPQDYRDPVYWGVPEELKERARKRREREKRPVEAPDETRDRVRKLREVVL